MNRSMRWGAIVGAALLAAGAAVADVDGVRAEGTYDGYDGAERAIWINDFRYTLYPGARVYSVRGRVSTLDALEPGRRVEVVIVPDPKSPSVPYVTEIHMR